MSEPTGIERLRAMLDERGVEYEVRVENITGIEHIIWHTDEFSQWDWNEEFGAGWLTGWQHDVTPEQAIAATLGPCSDSCNCTNGERTGERIDLDAAMLGVTDATVVRLDGAGTCHVMTISEFNGEGTEYYDYCSNCGYEFDDDPLNYCPNCGRRIEVDDG